MADTELRGDAPGFFDARLADSNDLHVALGLTPGSFEWHRLIERVATLAALTDATTAPWPWQVGDVVTISEYPEPVVKRFRIEALANGRATLRPCDHLGQPTADYTTIYSVERLRPAPWPER
jgi:hypothetical protein